MESEALASSVLVTSYTRKCMYIAATIRKEQSSFASYTWPTIFPGFVNKKPTILLLREVCHMRPPWGPDQGFFLAARAYSPLVIGSELPQLMIGCLTIPRSRIPVPLLGVQGAAYICMTRNINKVLSIPYIPARDYNIATANNNSPTVFGSHSVTAVL